MALTDAKVRSAKGREAQYKLADGHGLYLLVKPNGSRLWRYKFRLSGKEQLFAIGRYPEISLLQAREARAAAAQLVGRGSHPTKSRKAGKLKASHEAAATFSAVADEWASANKNWTPYYRRQVQTILKNDVLPAIGGSPIKEVKAAQLLAVIRQVEKRSAPSIAALIQMWASQIFRYAIQTGAGGVEVDPASSLRGVVSKPATRHKKALKKNELTTFIRRLNESDGEPHIRIGIELLMHMFVRPVELRCAQWSEFDFSHKQWNIPAERMKKRAPHVVPLTPQVIALLRELKALYGKRSLLFPNRRDPNRPMSATTMNRRIERMGYSGEFSAHGFRTTASTILNEHGYRADVIEKQLAHQERNATRRAYNHAEFMSERTEMMQFWSSYIEQSSGRKRARR